MGFFGGLQLTRRTSKPIRLAITGPGGQMGQHLVRALQRAPDIHLVAAISPRHAGCDVGEIAGIGALGLPVTDDLATTLAKTCPDVLVDFTRPDAAAGIAEQALRSGVRPVIGTSGLNESEIDRLRAFTETSQLSALLASNFALGAVLMMRFAREAARYFEHAEVLELHHDKKRDAPSGTSLQTVSELLSVRPQFSDPCVQGQELLPGARGAEKDGVRIHSVRLPGLLAHQEVLFGSEGQLLTLRHDAFDRSCYMPGVLLAVRKIVDLRGFLVGLESVL